MRNGTKFKKLRDLLHHHNTTLAPSLRRRFSPKTHPHFSHVPTSETFIQKKFKIFFLSFIHFVVLLLHRVYLRFHSIAVLEHSDLVDVKMNGGGRQGLRSSTTGVHHQRQYSENFLDGASTGNRWLQSAGLQHLQSSSAVNPLQVRFINFSFSMSVY